jgi:hypothetical protein
LVCDREEEERKDSKRGRARSGGSRRAEREGIRRAKPGRRKADRGGSRRR